MLAGGPNKDPAALRRRWYDERGFIDNLMDALIDATVDYLIAQIDAGADAIQLFDTWAGGMPEEVTRAVSLEPLKRIAERVKSLRSATPVILFPKGVGPLLGDYAMIEACDGVGIDFAAPWKPTRSMIAPHAATQGGLDPMLVVKGGEKMEKGARDLVKAFEGAPYIFNLGHGLTPDTPPENVARLVEIIRAG